MFPSAILNVKANPKNPAKGPPRANISSSIYDNVLPVFIRAPSSDKSNLCILIFKIDAHKRCPHSCKSTAHRSGKIKGVLERIKNIIQIILKGEIFIFFIK